MSVISTEAPPARVVSRDKAFGRILGSVAATAPGDVQAIVARTAIAAPAWAALPVRERVAVLARIRALALERLDELAELVALETGKTVVEAMAMELFPVVDTCRWLEANAEPLLGPVSAGTPQLILLGRRHEIRLEPYGVVGVISPWNYPVTVASAHILFNLVAGNAVVWKPSSVVPLLGEALRSLFIDAGVPDEAFRVVHGGADVGEALVLARGVEKVFFTGSEPVGRRVMELASRAPGHPKPVVLELGGKDAMLVLWDADIDRAAAGAAWAGFGHSGQSCGGVKRVYVDERVAERFEAKLVARARTLVPGDPLDPASQLGAMANAVTRDTVSALVRDALERGARLLAGGPDPIARPGAEPEAVGHLAATLLADVPDGARIREEEVFGPVVLIERFTTEDEAVRLANDTPFGLSASVWSRDLARAEELGRRLEVGSVLVNDHLSGAGVSQIGWAGRKASGFGVSRSRFGLWECIRPKSVSVDAGTHDPAWWHPYDHHVLGGFRAAIRAFYGDSVVARGRAVTDERLAVRTLARRMSRSAARGIRGRRAHRRG